MKKLSGKSKNVQKSNIKKNNDNDNNNNKIKKSHEYLRE